jgi:hypothetical protein
MFSQDENRTTADKVVTELRASSDARGSTKWEAWGLRPIVLFAAAYTIIGILHEWAHALTAYALKVPSTLFHLNVHLDRPDGTLNERAVIRVAGPLFCLGVGLVCWFAYRKAKGSRAKLPLLYLAWFGIGTLLGNWMSTPFVGDFSDLALAFQWTMPVRYGAGIVGLLLLSGFSFLIGMELRKWAPEGISGVKAMIGVIVLPVIVGTVLVILIYLPMPSGLAISRMAESSFWIFGAVGTLISRKHPEESNQNLGLGWLDFAILLVAVFVVRLMAGGIAFAP